MYPRFSAEASLYQTAGHYLSSFSKAGAGLPFLGCDLPGRRCCGPDSDVKTQHCDGSVGCNVATGRCEPCGGAGQVCCDGPYSGFSNKSYTGIAQDGSQRPASCAAGLRCDTVFSAKFGWLGSRRCQACGNRENGPCCAPDVDNALGHCIADATTGTKLACNNPYAGGGGTCVACGITAGGPACMNPGERRCVDGLIEQDGKCLPCGQAGQPICDSGQQCRDVSVPDRFYTTCVPAGGLNQPCFNGGCTNRNVYCEAGICTPCGYPDQPCCPPSTGWAPCEMGQCQNNACFACGYENQPVCAGNLPCPYAGIAVDGWCRPCGGEGQKCCPLSYVDMVCDSGLSCQDGTCRRPQAGGSGGGQAYTCGGQPYTFNTTPRRVFFADQHNCLLWQDYPSNSYAEAVQCAKKQHANVLDSPPDYFAFAKECEGSCDTVYFPGSDSSKAKDCVEYTYPFCTVSDGECP